MKEYDILQDAIIKAGDAIREISKKDIIKTQKSNNSPLTAADLSANQILKERLLGCFPEYGWLSEETHDDLTRLEKKRVWIVDPLDGTKEYINKIPEYVVSVALVEDGVPILAAILNPATEDLFYAMKGKGAWLNEKSISCDYSVRDKIEVLASRSEINKGDWQRFTDRFDVKPMGSIAYKLALVAASQTHATFSLEPRSEWDIAAGVLLIQEAGGIIHDLSGNAFIFNQKNIRVNGIIASSKNVYPEMMKKIEPELMTACA